MEIRGTENKNASHSPVNCIWASDSENGILVNDNERNITTNYTETENSLKDYWKARSESYSAQNITEMGNWKKDMWRNLILSNAPKKDGPLHILDIGTGPGFFAINLSLAGHAVSAVDITEDMLNHAKENAAAYGAKVDFHLALADELPFEENTFDLIVNRNVVWNLERPEQAFMEWKRVLKPGGRVVYFDSNWYFYLFDEKTAEWKRRTQAEWTAKYNRFDDGHPHKDNAHQKRTLELELLAKEKLPLSAIFRPTWDEQAWKRLEIGKVEVREGINKTIYSEAEQLYYESFPMFMVIAEK